MSAQLLIIDYFPFDAWEMTKSEQKQSCNPYRVLFIYPKIKLIYNYTQSVD